MLWIHIFDTYNFHTPKSCQVQYLNLPSDLPTYHLSLIHLNSFPSSSLGLPLLICFPPSSQRIFFSKWFFSKCKYDFRPIFQWFLTGLKLRTDISYDDLWTQHDLVPAYLSRLIKGQLLTWSLSSTYTHLFNSPEVPYSYLAQDLCMCHSVA